jgi:Sugar (and other) transporter
MWSPISWPLVLGAVNPREVRTSSIVYSAICLLCIWPKISFPFLSSPEHALQSFLRVRSNIFEESLTHSQHGLPNKQCLFHLFLRCHWSVLQLPISLSVCYYDLLTSQGGGLFGFDISSMAGVLGTEAYKRYFHNPRSYGQGAITAAMPFGSLVGALASSFIADKYSRKIAIQIASVIWIIGSM